jgi:hypothetical protein
MIRYLEDLFMETKKILVPESLQETLWRLEEVRQGFRNKSIAYVQEALQWVLARQGLPGSYSNLFMPTVQDLTQGAHLLTGERMQSGGGARHVLGEEALRTVILWNLGSAPAVTEALKGFNQIIERGGKSGSYCCHTCTISFLRTLAVVKPDEWEQILEKGLDKIRKARTSDGKWRGFPFYYTLLTLSEIDTASAHAELRHASKIAGRLLKRYTSGDRVSSFRRLALEKTLDAG